MKTWNFDDFDWLDRYDERMRGLGRLCYEETLRRLPEYAGVKAGDRVLDIGTGTGNSAVPFLQRGCRVVGLDPSQRMLERGEAKAAGWAGRLVVQHVMDPFLTLPCDDGTFAAVVSAYAIHHLDDAAKRVAGGEIKRVLQPGGRIVVADTMFRDATHKAQALAAHQDLEDEYQPLLTTFPSLLEAAGLVVARHQIGELVWVLVAEKAVGEGTGG